MNFRELYLEQCKVIASYQASLSEKEVELQSVKEQLRMMHELMSHLKADLNLKNEQFDYLFRHIDSHEVEGGGVQPKLPDYFGAMPVEVTIIILDFLDYHDLSSLGSTCRELSSLSRRAAIWKKLYGLRWGTVQGEGAWLDLYRTRHSVETSWFNKRPVVTTLTGHTGAINCIAFLQDTSRFIAGSNDGSISIWNHNEQPQPTDQIYQQHHRQSRPTAHLASFYGHGGPVWCSAVLDNNHFATGSYDKTVKVWNLDTWRCEVTLRGHSEWVSCLAAAGANIVSGSWDASLKVWDLTTRMPIVNLLTSVGNAIYCVDVEGARALSGCRFNTVDMWDLSAAQLVSQCVGHTKQVNCLNSDADVVASGSSDHSAKLWDLRTSQSYASLTGHLSPVMCLQLDLQASRLITGSYDKTVAVWDLRHLQAPRQVLKGHSSAVFCLVADSYKLLTGSSDKTVKIWTFS
jgi:WD40 repeat protein